MAGITMLVWESGAVRSKPVFYDTLSSKRLGTADHPGHPGLLRHSNTLFISHWE